ncbi:MAG: hypothetical protein ABEJ65_04775, partial [bacterium]
MAVSVFHRVAVHRWGRSAPLINPDNSRQVGRFRKASTVFEKKNVSVHTGREIQNTFHIQLPVNPMLFSQIKKLDLKSNHSYVITVDRNVYRILRTIPFPHDVYRNRYGALFDGVRPPGVYILESSLSPDQIRNLPWPNTKHLKRSGVQYLYLKRPIERRLLLNRAYIKPRVSKLLFESLPEPESLPPAVLNSVEKV